MPDEIENDTYKLQRKEVALKEIREVASHLDEKDRDRFLQAFKERQLEREEIEHRRQEVLAKETEDEREEVRHKIWKVMNERELSEQLPYIQAIKVIELYGIDAGMKAFKLLQENPRMSVEELWDKLEEWEFRLERYDPSDRPHYTTPKSLGIFQDEE